MARRPQTRVLHAAGHRADGAPSSPPIDTSSVHISSGSGDGTRHAYTRLGNPTWEALEKALGALEDASALAFASGQAATMALVHALCAERKRLVTPGDGYYGARKLLGELTSFGIEFEPVDLADRGAVRAALTAAPAVLWAETPTNPFLRVHDLEALAALARETESPLVVDNTTATAALQCPLDHGATATLTSLTKSSSGHSDVILGAVATRDAALLERLGTWRAAGGGIPGAFEAWIAHRGLLTLPLRIERQSANAHALATHLAQHARVRAVHYPGFDPATAELARRQMPRGGGPLLSFELDGDAAAAERVVRAAELFMPATSFGGVESSWERRARWASESAPANLIRMSVGIEDLADLTADLDAALAAR